MSDDKGAAQPFFGLRCVFVERLLAVVLFFASGLGYAAGENFAPQRETVGQWHPLQQAMLQAMQQRAYRGGVLLVVKDGQIVFEQGFGWADRAQRIAMQPTALLRIGSLAKLITQAMLKSLQRQGRLQLSDYAFCFSEKNHKGRCWLTIPTHWSVATGWEAVTLQHLLAHQAGLGSRQEDPALMELRVAQQLGVAVPPARLDLLRYALLKPPQPPVGTAKAYSNLGYELLGLVVEQAGGKSYVDLMHQLIFAPLQVAASEVQAARSLPADRDGREPEYIDDTLVPSLFAPGKQVYAPDGGYHQENLLAAGGLIATARALGRFVTAYWLGSGEPRRAGETGQYWQMEGVQRGMHALAEQWTQHGNDISLVALFNGYDAARAAALYGELEEGLRQVYPELRAGAVRQQGQDVQTQTAPGILSLLNQLRSEKRRCGAQEMVPAAPLRWQESLAQAAAGHAREQVLQRRPGIKSVDGRDLFARWRQQGYRSAAGYEYLLWLDRQEEAVIHRWLEQPEACRLLMQTSLKEVGIAIGTLTDAVGLRQGKRLLVMDFAIPER